MRNRLRLKRGIVAGAILLGLGQLSGHSKLVVEGRRGKTTLSTVLTSYAPESEGIIRREMVTSLCALNEKGPVTITVEQDGVLPKKIVKDCD